MDAAAEVGLKELNREDGGPCESSQRELCMHTEWRGQKEEDIRGRNRQMGY